MWSAVQAGDSQAIHEARKLTRRVAAVLALAGASRDMRRQWRKVRRALAPLRDRDAAGSHLDAALRELQVAPEQREQFHQDWAAARGDTLAALKLPKLPGKVKWPRHPKRRARRALAKQGEALGRVGPQALASDQPEDWHDWRKALKRYRYTLELLTPAPTPLRELLDALGRVQDADVLLEQLWATPAQFPQAPRLIQREERHLEQAKRQARRLWPVVAQELPLWGLQAAENHALPPESEPI